MLAYSSPERLSLTLNALAGQSRRADQVILVNQSDSEIDLDLKQESEVDNVFKARPKSTMGESVRAVVEQLVRRPTNQDIDGHAVGTERSTPEDAWLWLLPEGLVPQPTALAELLFEVEKSDLLVVAGPKLLDSENRDFITSMGETLSRFGASESLVEQELDQGQHDDLEDVLGVAAEGALVKLETWNALQGFDPGLPSIDACLDFCIRARLSGYRVAVAPKSRVETPGPVESLGVGKVTPAKRFRIARSAQLHRRLSYSPALAVPFHWISLIPLAIFRSIADLVGKYPDRIVAEFAAALRVAFGPGVVASRRNIRRTKKSSWDSVLPLRIPTRELRARRYLGTESEPDPRVDTDSIDQSSTRSKFFANGGIWTVLVLGLIGLVAFGNLLAGTAVVGGGLKPLSSSLAELWGNIGYGWRNLGLGQLGAADPFAVVLAILGSITFWNPSLSIVALYLAALPLAGIGGWFAARQVSIRLYLPILGAILWALAPPFLASLAEGRLGAVVAHILLPWLVITGLRAPRNWGAAAGSAILLAVVLAGAPSLAPAIGLMFVVLWVSHPLSLHRTTWIPIPAIVLFGPLVIEQASRGNWFALFADPGVPIASEPPTGFQLSMADPGVLFRSWSELLGRLGLSAGLNSFQPWLVVAILLGPIAIAVIATALIPGAKKALISLALAPLGLITASLASSIQVSSIANSAVHIWSGPGLSLYWMGLCGCVIIGLGKFGPLRIATGILTTICVAVLTVPLLGSTIIGTTSVNSSNGRTVPALVDAQAAMQPGGSMLVIKSEGKGISARIEPGNGSKLDDQSTVVQTDREVSARQKTLIELAGNLAIPSGFQALESFESLDIQFVLVPDSNTDDQIHRSILDALNGNEVLSPVGHTNYGQLWQVTSSQQPPPERLGNLNTPLGLGYLVLLGFVFGATLLLAVPIARARTTPVRDSNSLSLGEDEDD